MPDDKLTPLIRRTESTLRRADSECEKLSSDLAAMALRRELEGRRDEDRMRTAVGLDLIDRERRLIAEAVAGQ
jgi:hypothetical protein